MGRSDLERLSNEELIELVLRLQRPEKTSRTSSKPPSTDRKEQRERSKPGGAKRGHEGHSRIISDTPDEGIEHRPGRCLCCTAMLMTDLPAEAVSAPGDGSPGGETSHHAASAAGGALPGLRNAGRRPRAGDGTRHTVRAAAAAWVITASFLEVSCSSWTPTTTPAG